MFRFILCILGLALHQQLAFAKPPSAEICERQQEALERLKASIDSEVSIKVKFRLLTIVLSEFSISNDVSVRHQILKVAEAIDAPEQQEFLISCLKTEDDSLLRGHIATFLGRKGSKELLPILVKVASSDPTTSFSLGCHGGGQGSARRNAIFAIAELTERFPELATNAAEQLRTLPILYGDDSVADARRQVLFQITRDETLLQPFYDRLESKNFEDRQHGLSAFQFLKLKTAPQPVIDALDDADDHIRRCAIHVLGEIGDSESAEPLMAIAGNPKAERGLRRSAISALGKMRAKAAADLMANLLTDGDVSAGAALALDQINGKADVRIQGLYDIE